MEDDKSFDSFTKVVDGLSIKDLVKNGASEFTVDLEDDLWVESDLDKQVETLYEYEDYEKHVNLDCIQCDPDDVDGAGTPFEKLSRSMTDVTPDGKLKKKILKSGTTKIPKDSIVYLHYNSYLEMQEVPFDSSYLRHKEPVRFHMGHCGLYPGFELAVCSMCVGEKAQFLIHHDLALGELGSPPRIPPASTIFLVVEVFKAVDCGNVKEDEPLTLADRKEFSTAYKLAKQAHERANDYFSSRNIHGAIEYYRRAENALLRCSVKSDEEEEKMKYLLLKIYVNMTVCYNTDKMKQPERVCVAARKAIELDPKNAMKNAKLFYNRGLANQALCNYKLASQDFRRAQKLEPNNAAINKAILLLDEKRKSYYAFEKSSYQKMFGFGTPDESEKYDSEEIDDECKKVVTEKLEEFANGNKASIPLSSGFTYSERAFIKREVDRLGLVFEETVIAGRRNINVSKKYKI